MQCSILKLAIPSCSYVHLLCICFISFAYALHNHAHIFWQGFISNRSSVPRLRRLEFNAIKSNRMWEAFRTTARSARDSTRSYESCMVWSSDWDTEEITTVESCPAWSSDWDKEDIIRKRTLKDCYYWIQEVANQQSCCICHCNRRRCTRDMLYAMPLWLQTDAQATC